MEYFRGFQNVFDKLCETKYTVPMLISKSNYPTGQAASQELLEVLHESTSPWPYCATRPEKDHARRSRAKALDYPFLRVNGSNKLTLIVLDIDDILGLETVLDSPLLPFYVVVNNSNGHVHAAWLLETPVHFNWHSNVKCQQWVADIADSMTRFHGADTSFDNLGLSKNPLCPPFDHTTVEPGGTPYSLTELSKHYPKPKAPRKRRPFEDLSSIGRNCHLFQEARLWAYGWRVKGNLELSLEATYSVVLSKVEQLNKELFSIALPMHEVRSVARGVSKWIVRKFSTAELSRINTYRADILRWGHLKERNALVFQMLDDGWSHSQVAERTTAAGWKMTRNAVACLKRNRK